jgi:GNAT superfamily N-acetyltransferase
MLKDGRRIHLRPLEPGDKDALSEGFARLSKQSKYFRFLSPMGRLTAAQLRYLTEVDQEKHHAWGAYIQSGEREIGVGVARCIRLDDEPDMAEFAVTVVDEYQLLGAGRILLEKLIRSARRSGITAFRGYVHRDNELMKNLLRSFVDRLPRSAGPVRQVEFPL